MLSDLRFALRQLAKTPAFTTIALLTLAIGIGSAAAVFSAVNGLLLKPLPLIKVAEDRLFYITQTDEGRGLDDIGWNFLDAQSVRERATSLAGLWVHSDLTAILAGSEIPERLRATSITWDAFDLMGLAPVRGRGFAAADAGPEGKNVALISTALWKKRFGSAEDVVGRTTTLNGRPTTIIGIMPDGWRYPEISDLWLPLRADDKSARWRGYYGLSGRAILRAGVSREQAQAEISRIMAGLSSEFPLTNAGIGARLRPIREQAVENTTQFSLRLFGAVIVVFLIACVNVANLLLARATTRSREVAIRLALGASRPRVVRQLVTESVVLGALGGVGGFVLALWGIDAMTAAVPIDLPFWLRFDFDVRGGFFIAGLSLLSALIFGGLPALRTSRPDVVNELKEGGRSAATSGPRALRLRSLLVVSEIALALLMLVGAGLMLRSFLKLRAIDPGFEPRGVLTFRTGWPADMVRDDPSAPGRFFDAVLARLAALPGVESAALVNWLPGRDGTGSTANVQVSGRPPPSAPAPAKLRLVSENYFRTLHIPLLAGRGFDETLDHADAPRVVLVDDAFAVRHFGTAAAALGQKIAETSDHPDHQREESKGPPAATIVGVVGGIRHQLDRADDRPTLYLSRKQAMENFQSVVVRTRTDAADLVPSVREAIMAVNREIPIYDVRSLEEVMLTSRSVWPLRFFSTIFSLFGAIALFLACIGIYGVVAYNVAQREQELGVRLALGAQPREIIHLVLRHGLGLVACGLGVGLVAAYFLSQVLGALLYGISPRDPPTFATVPLLLAVIAFIACWLPVRRATLIEPNAALRGE